MSHQDSSHLNIYYNIRTNVRNTHTLVRWWYLLLWLHLLNWARPRWRHFDHPNMAVYSNFIRVVLTRIRWWGEAFEVFTRHFLWNLLLEGLSLYCSCPVWRGLVANVEWISDFHRVSVHWISTNIWHLANIAHYVAASSYIQKRRTIWDFNVNGPIQFVYFHHIR